MPGKTEHVKKAEHNEAFVASVPTDSPFIDWAITALFYAGLHYMEAYFATRKIHSADHRTRDSSIQRDPNIKELYTDFSELKNYSINARYYLVPVDAQELVDLKPRLEKIKRHLGPYLHVAP